MIQFPNETLLNIFKFLDFYKLILIQKTNRHFCSIIKKYELELAKNFNKMPAVNLIADILELPLKRLNNNINISDVQHNKLSKAFNGITIRLTNWGQKGKTYQVIGITHLSSQTLKFKFKAKKSSYTNERTVSQHFFTQYHKHLLYPFLPCIHVSHHLPTMYFPPEICEIF
ncbi:PAZ domain-containing protein [Meloidogyne graminicola]|uniref:PAZ domain-containing protein n=1 Tax=Meloidogyne graminicola TaxID=189291 RepID=A0A8S9ZWQ7_9BILA|nr:PAZ domain-containing protein [Meloidogyne graminicola]